MPNKSAITLEEFMNCEDEEERTRLTDAKEVFMLIQSLISAQKTRIDPKAISRESENATGNYC